MPDVDFAEVLTDADKFMQSPPYILELIEDDLDAHARKKKKLRIRDRNWELKQRFKEEGREGELDIEPISEEEISLEEGRPRTSACMVFIGRASRRGKEYVQTELMEDVIAYNFLRMTQVRRKRKQREEKEPCVA